MFDRPRMFQVAAAVMLAAFAVHRYLTVRPPPGVGPYLERIRAAADGVPRRVGGWVGEDVPVPGRVTTVLRPNVLLSRRYTNVENGAAAGVLLVHTANAHHMVGHFPMRCYPANGWAARERRPREWAVGGLTLAGTEYRFAQPRVDDAGAGGERTIVVVNALLRPGGQVMRDMDELTRDIVGADGPALGAGQIQFYFEGAADPATVDAAVTALAEGYRPVLQAILADAVGRVDG